MSIILKFISLIFEKILSVFVDHFIRKISPHKVLPFNYISKNKEYSSLETLKYEYRIAINHKTDKPCWIRSNIKLKLHNNLLSGIHKRYYCLSPKKEIITFRVTGEIRNGKMIFTETNLDNHTHYFSAIYNNLLSPMFIGGILIDFEDNKFPSTYTILSTELLESKDLNGFLLENNFTQLIDIETISLKIPEYCAVIDQANK
jgi:hypothetical protein